MRTTRFISLLLIALALLSLPALSQEEYSPSVSTDKSTYRPGETVKITVKVIRNDTGEPVAGCMVGIEIKDPRGGGTSLPPKKTDSNGIAIWYYPLDEQVPEGTWTVIAAVSGGGKDNCTFTVRRAAPPPPGKKPSRITISLSKSVVEWGEPVLISGDIVTEETIHRARVTVRYTTDNRTWHTIAEVEAVDGHYECEWAPPAAGVYFIRASWPGTDEYEGATSPAVRLTVTRRRVALTLTASKRELVEGEQVVISGELEPPLAGVEVTLEYRLDGAWLSLARVVTDGEGRFTLRWFPPPGNITVRATWPGDDRYEAAYAELKIRVLRRAVRHRLSRGVEVESTPAVRVEGEFKAEESAVRLVVEGPRGEAQVITVRVPVSLLEELGSTIEDVTVFVNGTPVDFVYELRGGYYVIRFVVEFSRRLVEVVLQRAIVSLALADPRGRPLAGAVVRAYRGQALLAAALTNSSGVAELRVPVGPCRLEVEWRGVVLAELSARVAPEGASINRTVEVYDIAVTVASQVLGQPLPFRVAVSGPVALAEAAGADGRVVLAQLPPGNYTVVVEYVGGRVERRVELTEDVELSLRVPQAWEAYLVAGVAALAVGVVLAAVGAALAVRARRKLRAAEE